MVRFPVSDFSRLGWLVQHDVHPLVQTANNEDRVPFHRVENDVSAREYCAIWQADVGAQRALLRPVPEIRKTGADQFEILSRARLAPFPPRVARDVPQIGAGGSRNDKALHSRAKNVSMSSLLSSSVVRPAAISASPLASADFSRFMRARRTSSVSFIRRKASRMTSLALL